MSSPHVSAPLGIIGMTAVDLQHPLHSSPRWFGRAERHRKQRQVQLATKMKMGPGRAERHKSMQQACAIPVPKFRALCVHFSVLSGACGSSKGREDQNEDGRWELAGSQMAGGCVCGAHVDSPSSLRGV